MKHDIDYYRKVQKTNGVSSKKEAQIRAIRRQVQKSFKSVLNWESVLINGTPFDLQIMPAKAANAKAIKGKPEQQLRLGDIVEWQGSYWIVDSLDSANTVNYLGTMMQCNTVLRWQLPDGEIRSEYTYTKDASKYALGEDGGTYIDTASFTMKAYAQINSYTLQIRRGQRFLLGYSGVGLNPMAVEVTRVNGITNTYIYDEENGQAESGIIEFTLAETQFKEGIDNPELGIADYKSTEQKDDADVEDGGWFG